ncbi:hypothetical protein [Streptomyces sp. NPDC057253]|uniref:hypothetical protein n=1 Tax=Streptomyces sp. NPDC057253 TaxID=3346069 RepID=UPI003630BB77
MVVKQDEHWDGLPTGKNRRTTTSDEPQPPRSEFSASGRIGPLQALLNRSAAPQREVG